jgi:tetratricopeptide (TPR) repeat protein
MKKMDPAEENADLLTVNGVSAINENDWPTARQDFLHAYSLDPASAFSLNNRGYVAEMDGDIETAEFFYDKARQSGDSNARVGLATLRSAEGKRLSTVATDSGHHVNDELDKYSQKRRREPGPIELTPRNNAPAGISSVPAEKPSSSDIQPAAAPSVPQP